MAVRSKSSDIKVVLLLGLLLCFTTVFVVFDMSELTPCPDNATLQLNDPLYSQKIVLTYVKEEQEGLRKLQLDENSLGHNEIDLNSEPVIVTATSATHWSNVILWVKEMNNKQLGRKLLVYDIGMTSDQRKQLCSKGECEVRGFPFDQFPKTVKTGLNYLAWKPILIQICLLEYKFVMWMDCTIHLTDNTIEKGVQVARDHGIAIPYKAGIDVTAPLHYVTSQAMFDKFREQPCAFHNVYSFNAGVIIIVKTDFTQRYIMRPWVYCALEEQCISGGYTAPKLCAGANTIGYCHKYDTSALSIILHRLYNTEEERSKIDLSGRINWVKCYVRKELVVWDDAVFTDFQKYDQRYCRNLEAKFGL